ncbi:MAG TPA: PA14 domain-containing protein, partial [Candidatus Saccharimonadales bacterium]|nr:PA14 domain-containing protein [Candidatus Saccharimonadales bacterium]
VPATRWSARWKGTLTPSQTGVYKVTATADDGVRVFVDGKLVIDDWTIHPPRKNTGTIRLSQGQSVAIVVEYFQWEGGSQLEVLFSMSGAPPSHQGEFLKRLTPMNFYPLAAGVPDKNRAQHVLQLLMDPNKFWGRYLLPTLAYDDPDYLAQEYWRGDVWGPPNYIVWQGLKKYASPAQMTEFAERNVELFMTNWIAKGVCGENYLSTDGSQAHDPHYTWGALLCLIGLENIVDVDDSGHIILNGAQTRNIMLQNIPLLGRRYDVKTAPGSATLIQNGKAILTAKATIVQAAI